MTKASADTLDLNPAMEIVQAFVHAYLKATPLAEPAALAAAPDWETVVANDWSMGIPPPPSTDSRRVVKAAIDIGACIRQMETALGMVKKSRRVRGRIPDFSEAQVSLIAFDAVAYRLVERMNRFWGLSAPRAGLEGGLLKLPKAMADIKRRRGVFTHEHDIHLIDDSSTPLLMALLVGAAESDKDRLRSLVFAEARAAYRRRIDASVAHLQEVLEAATEWVRDVFVDAVLDWDTMIFGPDSENTACPA